MARQSSSKYFISELHSDARSGVRIFGLIFVVNHQRMAVLFETQHRLVPCFARVGANRLAIILDDKTDWQIMIRRILEAFMKDAGFGGHFTGETMHASFFPAAFNAQRRAHGYGQDAGDDG